MSKLLYNVYEKSSSPRNPYSSRERQFKLRKLETALSFMKCLAYVKETCCTHEHKNEDLNLNTNRTKNSLKSSSQTRACSLRVQHLLTMLQAKCINNPTMLRRGFAVGLHVHSQPRFVFFFRFVERGLSHEQENRFSSEDKGKGKFPLRWSIFLETTKQLTDLSRNEVEGNSPP